MSKAEHFGWPQILLSFLTLGLYAIVSAIIASRTRDPQLKRGDRIKCRNCGSRYIFEQ